MNQHNFFRLILLLAVTILFFTCKEVPPPVNFSPITELPDTSVNSQKRNVLLEEITGVHCVNCPAGHEIAENIATAHPGRVVNLAIHAGQYAYRYPFSNYNFKITEGVSIYDMIGHNAQPCADVNRVLFNGQTSKFLIPASTWPGYVENELNDTLPKVKIGLSPSYNSSSRQLDLGVKLFYTQDVSTANNLSVMITESGMIDPQEVPISVKPSGIDTFYVHRHALRGMLTPFNGQVINGNKTPGSPISITLPSFAIPVDWNADSCNIIVFVTEGTDSVLQVVQTPMKK